MKTKIIMLALLCTACAEKTLSNQEVQNLLSQYTWAYTPPNSDIPIELTFKDNQLGAYTSCNYMGTPYKIIEQQIITQSSFISDAMGCPSHLEKQESFIKGLFEQPVAFKISSRSDQYPKLIFQKDQQEYTFIGTKVSHKNKNAHGE